MHRVSLVPADAPALGVRTLLDLASRDGAALRAGSVTLAPGQRVPADGWSTHTAEELSLVTAGSLSGVAGDDAFEVVAGEVTLIPAGEEHWAVAGPAGAEVFWVWFGDVEG
jgi:quercetin dioxygenase-like cupin family protein